MYWFWFVYLGRACTKKNRRQTCFVYLIVCSCMFWIVYWSLSTYTSIYLPMYLSIFLSLSLSFSFYLFKTCFVVCLFACVRWYAYEERYVYINIYINNYICIYIHIYIYIYIFLSLSLSLCARVLHQDGGHQNRNKRGTDNEVFVNTISDFQTVTFAKNGPANFLCEIQAV